MARISSVVTGLGAAAARLRRAGAVEGRAVDEELPGLPCASTRGRSLSLRGGPGGVRFGLNGELDGLLASGGKGEVHGRLPAVLIMPPRGGSGGPLAAPAVLGVLSVS